MSVTGRTMLHLAGVLREGHWGIPSGRGGLSDLPEYAGYLVHSWVPQAWVRGGLVVVGGEKKEKEGEIMDLREVIEGDSSSEEGEEDECVGLLKKI